MEINLANPERGLKFEARKYPDGQQDIILASSLKTSRYLSIDVISRFNSFKDLELILCTVAALRNCGVVNISLIIPYLLGGRSDRQFEICGTSYLRDVVAPIINSMHCDKVDILDPHSDVTSAVIKNIHARQPDSFWKFFVRHSQLTSAVVLVPDAGAQKRVYSFAEKSSLKIDDIVCCSKHRDIHTGKILETIVPVDDFSGHDVVIVDDLCDGGRTFIEIAKLVKNKNCGKIFLVITHGVFSKGIDPLREYFNHVYCTNSYSDVNDPLVSQYDVMKANS